MNKITQYLFAVIVKKLVFNVAIVLSIISLLTFAFFALMNQPVQQRATMITKRWA